METSVIADDKYRLFIPIEDHDLLKSVEIDGNGDYIVQGVMSSDEKDEENDSITPEGMDCSYFLNKGWVKYEHGNSPDQFIGEPLEVRVGQFEHPTLHKSVNGVFVKARLFAQRKLAKAAVAALEDLQKSNTKRRMGWSIEGNVIKRDRTTGKIVKSVLRNVVLTLNPVNTTTWAELAKSFAKDHELIIDTEEDLTKAMDLAGAAPVTKQSLEGANQEDDQKKWISMFRDFVHNFKVSKSLSNTLLKGSSDKVATAAYTYALRKGLNNEDAYEFASYISGRQADLVSLIKGMNKSGGGNMAKKRIESLLDPELEELRKSLAEDNDDDDNGGTKHKNNDDDDDDDNNNDDDNDNDDNDDDDKTEKSIKSTFAKSFAKDSEYGEAIEVSEFLAAFADQIGVSIDGLEKSIGLSIKKNNLMVKSLTAALGAIQDLTIQVEEIKSDRDELAKSLNQVLEMPVGRRSVVSQKEVNTLKKSIDASKGNKVLNRKQIGDVLMKSFEAGDISGTAITRFEAGVGLHDLELPESVKEQLGM